MPMCTKIGPETCVSKDKIRIPMCIRIGLEFQRLKWKEKIRIPMFMTIRPEFQCSEG